MNWSIFLLAICFHLWYKKEVKITLTYLKKNAEKLKSVISLTDFSFHHNTSVLWLICFIVNFPDFSIARRRM